MRNCFYLLLIVCFAQSTFARGLKSTSTLPAKRVGVLPFDFAIYKSARDKLLPHSYNKPSKKALSFFEINRGLFYTCENGFVDLAHLKLGVDYGAFFVKKVEEAYNQGRLNFTVKTLEKDDLQVKLQYPSNWEELTDLQKEEKIKELSLSFGLYTANSFLIWHEIASWYGWSATAFKYAEKGSAFSYEDLTSNVLGLHVAKRAILNQRLSFNAAVTAELNRRFNVSGNAVKRLPRDSMKELLGMARENNWYERKSRRRYIKELKVRGLDDIIKVPRVYGIANYVKRRTDIAIDGGLIWPMTLINIEQCQEIKAEPMTVPGAYEVSEGGRYADLLDINIIIKNKLKKDFLAEKSFDGNEVVNVKTDFERIVRILAEEMVFEFGEDVVK